MYHIDIEFGFEEPPLNSDTCGTHVSSTEGAKTCMFFASPIPSAVVLNVGVHGFSDEQKEKGNIEGLQDKLKKCVEEHFAEHFAEDFRERCNAILATIGTCDAGWRERVLKEVKDKLSYP